MTITVHDLYEKTLEKEDLLWLDVRTTAEFMDERPACALVQNLPLDQIISLDVEQDQPIFVSCLSGKRSQAAKEILMRKGYSRVVNVIGGFVEWKNAQLPVTK